MKFLKRLFSFRREASRQIQREWGLKITDIDFSCFVMIGEGTKKWSARIRSEFTTITVQISYFFCVFDGHGSSGEEASGMASDSVSSEIEKRHKEITNFKTDDSRIKFLKNIFRYTENVFFCPKIRV
jgi:hypothetical protein